MMRIRTARPLAAAIALLLIGGLVAGCSSLSAERSASDESVGVATAPSMGGVTEEYANPEAASDSEAGKDAVADVAEQDRLVIRSKMLRLEVESTSETVDAIRALASEHSGVITDLQVASDTEDPIYYYDEYGNTTSDALRGWVTVRVPADTFETFIDAASKLGTVKYQSEASEDVTQQHVDMAARLENLRAEEVRLRQFFDEAKNVSEMLSIEQELSRVRGEIESLDAQVKYLERQAAMATVTIELTEPKDIVRPEGESWGFAEAITAGVRGAASVVTFALSFLIATSPLWGLALLVVLVILAVRFIRRRRRAARAASEPELPTAITPDATETVRATPADEGSE